MFKLGKEIVLYMEKVKDTSVIKCISKGVIISILFTIIALSIFSILLVKTNISEETIDIVIPVITCVSILVGSSISMNRVKKNGLVNGAIIGAIYIFIIYLISSIVNSNFTINRASIIMMTLGIIGGVLGGIVGINLKK